MVMDNLSGASLTPPPAGAALPRATRRSVLRWTAAFAAILIAALAGLLTLLLIGLDTGPVALLIGFVLATLPVPGYIALVLWIDRYEPEPPWMLATAFFWGALIAVFIAFVLNTTGGLIVAALAGNKAGEFFAADISAPVVEESAKALVLFGIYIWKKDEFDGVIDGIVYAALVGLGFAMTENIQYYGGAALKGGIAGSLGLFILRGIIAPFSHPLFTSMTGIGLGLASQSNKKAIKFFAPAAGLAAAMLLHETWNLSASINGLLLLAVYFFIMMPIFVAVLVAIFFGLKREGRIVREQLQYDLQSGLFRREDYESLCSVRGRMGASLNALRKGGYGAWRARMEYHHLASELAFLRNRVSRGLLPWDGATAEREAVYRRLLYNLQRGQL